MGSRHEIAGLLLRRDGRLVLDVDGGGTWRLDAPGRVEALVGSSVVVNGVRSSFDLLDVTSIRALDAPIDPQKPWWRRLF